MGGEMLNAAMLSFGLIFVGWAIGALLLKMQGAEEKNGRRGKGGK